VRRCASVIFLTPARYPPFRRPRFYWGLVAAAVTTTGEPQREGLRPGCSRQDAIDLMRPRDRLRLRAAISVERGPDAGGGEQRPVLVEREHEICTLALARFDPMAYIDPCLLVLRHGSPAESDGRRESLGKNFHRQPGPIPGLYPPLHTLAPPSSGRNRHAGILPRRPTIGSPDGADARTGGIDPKAAKDPRSIELLIDRNQLPQLL
jgi:hypothetical protein